MCLPSGDKKKIRAMQALSVGRSCGLQLAHNFLELGDIHFPITASVLTDMTGQVSVFVQAHFTVVLPGEIVAINPFVRVLSLEF